MFIKRRFAGHGEVAMRFVGTSYTRVESQTAPAINERIRAAGGGDVAYFAQHPEEIDARLAELDREWDVERWLQLNSSVISLIGLGLGLFRDRRWLLVPAAVQIFFLQHGVQGWCPPLPAFRRLGVRTIREIETERNALKALRGDFAPVNRGSGGDGEAAIRAVSLNGSQTTESQAADTKVRPATIKPTRFRVRENTPRFLNERIDRSLRQRIRYYAARPELARGRLRELDREWDIERLLEVEAPITSLLGLAMSVTGKHRRGWLMAPIFVQSMMALHAVRGAYPLIPALRWLGLRTTEEIAAERYALKAILGDFAHLAASGGVSETRTDVEAGDAAYRAAAAPRWNS
jgi:hypothetical protein